MINNAVKNFDVLAINLNVPYSYFDNLIKLFLYLYPNFQTLQQNHSAKIFLLLIA